MQQESVDQHRNRSHEEAAFFLVIMMTHVPFLFNMSQWLWHREHYQFYPIVLIGSAFILWSRISETEWTREPARLDFASSALLCLSIVMSGTAILIQNNWLGTCAAVCWLITLNELFAGPKLVRQARGPLLLLLLIIPLPLNLDRQLIIGLQELATQFASKLLDVCHIEHAVSGVAIETVGKAYMVEEACSGVHSLFSCVCAIAFISTLLRYGAPRIIVNIIQTAAWVVLANALRVFLIVYSDTAWGMSLDHGLRHELLGALTYAIALCLALSTDRLFLFFVPARRNEASSKRRFANNAVLKLQVSRRTTRRSLWTSVIFLVCAFVFSSSVQSRNAPAPTVVNTVFRDKLNAVAASDAALLTEIDGWRFQKSRLIERAEFHSLGARSREYIFQKGELTFVFSVDAEFSEWNDVLPAYQSDGWNLVSKTKSQSQSDRTITLVLYSEDGDYSTCINACVDSQGNRLTPAKINTFSWRAMVQPFASSKLEPALPVCQTRLFYKGKRMLLDEEIAAMKLSHNALTESLIDSLLDRQEKAL